MSWLYQPFPLAATAGTNPDVTVALDASALEVATAAGTSTPSHAIPTTTSVAASGVGTLTYSGPIEVAATGSEVATEQGSFGRTEFVRLRSRKVGGASTADRVLEGSQALAQQGTASNVVSVLLGGTGVTTAQQSFPTRQTSCLLTGQVRATGQGSVVYVNLGAGAGLPSWVQQPTVVDERNYYATDFGTNTGKDVVWTNANANVEVTGFASTVTEADITNYITFPGNGVHGEMEGDDLWTHYNQWKRTGNAINFNWASAWRDFFVNTYTPGLIAMGPVGSGNVFGVSCNNYDHLFGQGLVMWGMERNDLAAKNSALALAAQVESQTYTLTPGDAATAPSLNESRRHARRLLFYNYIVMMEPIARWIAVRDHALECWLQNPLWHDTTHSTFPTIIGGNHFAGRISIDSWTTTNWDQGLRWDHSFMYALKAEALWLSYKMVTDSTRQTALRNMLIEMGRFVLHYGWDPAHANPTVGARWGYRPLTGAGAAPAGMGTAGFLHDYADEYTSPAGVVQNPYPPLNTNPNVMPASNYETSLINGLVYAYKLTGETAFLKRAREHWRQATQYAGDSSGLTKLNATQVHFFMDTDADTSTTSKLFDYNKGMQQYAGHLFENGGLPATEGVVLPYTPPSAPGQVVQIGGQVAVYNPLNSSSSIYSPVSGCLAMGGGSTYETNVWADVRPPEVGSASKSNECLIYNDGCVGTLIEAYSTYGAIGWAGGGGHHGTPLFGGAIFDFSVGKWKRHWTGGNTTENVELVSGTRTHNLLNLEPDLEDIPAPNDGTTAGHGDDGNPLINTFTQTCWNHEHWNPTQHAFIPLVADPRNQTWEITWPEPYPWSATKIPGSATGSESNPITSGPHGWKYPGEWSGLQFGVTGKTYGGLVGNGIAGRHAPTPGMPIPAPMHIWQLTFQVTPDQGGGPQGSFAYCRGAAGGGSSSSGMDYSYRFQWDTGTWHQYSINASKTRGTQNFPNGGSPVLAVGAISSAYDPVRERIYMSARQASTEKLNYMNHSDRTWRNMSVGSGGGTTGNASLMVDPDRRLLVTTCASGFFVRAINLANLVGDTGIGSNPTSAVGGYQQLNVTAAAGFTLPDNTVSTLHFDYPWVYYPPNGKYYRLRALLPAVGSPGGLTVSQHYANPENLVIRTLERLTPPPIVTPFPATVDYYIDQPWTYDTVTLGTPVPRTSWGSIQQALHNRNFFYVPSLQCFAWFPLDTMISVGEPESRRGVYLIKPI